MTNTNDIERIVTELRKRCPFRELLTNEAADLIEQQQNEMLAHERMYERLNESTGKRIAELEKLPKDLRAHIKTSPDFRDHIEDFLNTAPQHRAALEDKE